jgi:hypothetical protein
MGAAPGGAADAAGMPSAPPAMADREAHEVRMSGATGKLERYLEEERERRGAIRRLSDEIERQCAAGRDRAARFEERLPYFSRPPKRAFDGAVGMPPGAAGSGAPTPVAGPSARGRAAAGFNRCFGKECDDA